MWKHTDCELVEAQTRDRLGRSNGSCREHKYLRRQFVFVNLPFSVHEGTKNGAFASILCTLTTAFSFFLKEKTKRYLN